jgi:hypothetical protein
MRAGIARSKSDNAQNKGRSKQEYQERCGLTESHRERHRLDLHFARIASLNPDNAVRFLYKRQTIIIVQREKDYGPQARDS